MKKLARLALPWVVVLLALALGSPIALAETADETPPMIVHEPVTTAYEGQSITIRAAVTDDTEVSAVYTYFKPVGTDTFLFVSMSKGTESYVGQIPSRYVTVVGALQYYIVAVDSSGNTSTLKDGLGEPFGVEVVSLAEVEPQATLIYPLGTVTQASGVVISIRLNEVFALANRSVFTVTFDGQDVTDSCTITRSSITYAVPGRLSSGKYEVKLHVSDVNGQPYSAVFTMVVDVPEEPAAPSRPVSGSITTQYAYDSRAAAGSVYARLNVSGDLGPFSARASIRTDDPMFTGASGQPKNQLSIGYRSRFLDLDLIDSSPHLSSLTVNRYPTRGVSGVLKLGPFRMTSAYGLSRQAVPGESYARQILALRSSTNWFGVLETGMNFAQVADQVVDAAGNVSLIDGVSADQSYTASVDGKITLFGASLGIEVASNISFIGVQDRMNWEQLLTDAGVDNAAQYAGVLNVLFPVPDYYLLKQVIDALSEGDPLPPEFDLANIVFPVLDTACRAALEIPIAGSKLQADYFWTGQRFQPLAAAVSTGYRGYEVKVSSVPIGDIARISLSAGSKVDKVESPLINPTTVAEMIGDLGMDSDPVSDAIVDLLLAGIGTDAGSDQTAYDSMGVSFSASPRGLPSFSFDYDQTKKKTFATGSPKSEGVSYQVGVDRIEYSIAGARGTVGFGLKSAQEIDLALHQDSERTAALSFKTTLPLAAVRTSLKVEIGRIVSLKNESIASDDITLDTNTFEIKASKGFGKLALSTGVKYVKKDNGLASGSDAVGSTSLAFVVSGQYSMGRGGSIGVQIRSVNYVDRLDSSKNEQTSTVSASYRLAF